MSFSRSQRVEQKIQQELSSLLLFKAKDPRLEKATITRVKVTKDLKLARVYYGILGRALEPSEMAEALSRAHGFIKRELARVLDLRYMPELEFFYDESIDHGERIDRLLDEVRPSEPAPEEDEESADD